MTVTLQDVANELGIRTDGRRGERVHAYCPVHDDSTPDLVFYQDWDNFYCFPGDEGGASPVTLVMHCEQLDKDTAVEWVQDRFPDEFTEQTQDEISRRTAALDVLDKAATLAHDTLTKQRTDLHENIQERRDFPPELIEDVQIGFLSGEDIDILRQRFEEQVLKDSGLFGETGDGELYCHLANRIVYPYRRGKRTYFMIGRALPDSDADDKYRKTRVTDFNRHILLEYRTDNDDELIITEGVTDAISAYHAGHTVVSPVTRQFRDKDVEKLVNRAEHFDTVYIAMDQDGPGQEGAEKTARELVRSGIDPVMVELPEGQDLDDYTSLNGYDLDVLLGDADTYLRNRVQQAEEADGNSDNQERSRIVKDVLELIRDWDVVDQDPWLEDLPGAKKDLKSQLKEMQEDTKLTNSTKTTNQETGPATDSSSELDPDTLLDQEPPTKRRLSGVVDDTFYLTVWLYQDDRYRRAVVTSGGDVEPVRNRKAEMKQQHTDWWEDIPQERKEAWDYDYVDINGTEVQFKHTIPEEPVDDLRAPTNQLLRYLTGQQQVPEKEELFDRLKGFIRDYWDHYHDEWYDVVAAYIVHTYLIDPLGYTVYLYLHGEPDTGKSSLQKAMTWLQYNGYYAGTGTPATVMRYAHSYQASIHLAEQDKQSRERKKQVAGFFNEGQRKGAVYPITNTDRLELANQIQEIYAFNPKVYSANSVYGWADSFSSRCLFLKCARIGDVDVQNPDHIAEKRGDEVRELRDQLAAYCLFNWEAVRDAVDAERDRLDVTGREEDKLALFGGIVRHFNGDGAAEGVLDRIREEEGLTGVQDLNPSDREALEYVAEQVCEADGLMRIKFKEIRNHVNEELGLNPDEDEYAVSSRGIGSKLRGYDLIRDDSMKLRDADGNVCVELDRETFVDSMNRYDLPEIRDRARDTDQESGSSGSSPSSAPSDRPAEGQDTLEPETEDGPREEVLGLVAELAYTDDGAHEEDIKNEASLNEDRVDRILTELAKEGEIVSNVKDYWRLNTYS
ncbi:MAG: toprim domain-containing protein [Candidatus Nanohaloarchaea archaeon]|nr:toprim domain-containing protein [Candidatus Nanohaloarchaea archaeon]